MEKAYAIWRAFQDRLVAPVAALLLVGCTLLALLEIFRRYIMGVSFDWQQDAVTFFTLSGVYLYFAISQRRDEHLMVTVVPEVLTALGGTRGRRIADLLKLASQVIACAFLIAVVWWGIPEVEDSIRYETRTESLAFPMWPFLAVLLASFALMAVSLLFQIYRGVQKLRGRTVLAEPAEMETALH
jgi:TRAP-type C4-dicarboxylate transport system permease small subunit